jgi:T5SS/PEP-CTERM-associated repeat protein
MPLPAGTISYSGLGQAGNWADPANWVGGVPATLRSIVLIPVNATLNGAITVRQMMMLGDEQVTVNGTLTTRSDGPCKSFMVCEDAVATFTPTSTLQDNGGLIVGVDDVGTLIAQGTASAHSTLNTQSAKIGQKAAAIGTITIDGAQWQNASNFYVGEAGRGTLNILHGGQVSVGTSFVVGDYAGATGVVSLASGAQLTVDSYVKIGGGSPQAPGGSGTVIVGARSAFTIGGPLKIASTSSLTLTGGMVTVRDATLGVQVWGGAAVSGHGTLSSIPGGINDAGSITAMGGALVVDGTIAGAGALQIGGGSILVLNASTIGHEKIAFLGTGGTLDLAHGVSSSAVISGFGSGDAIVMPGVDQIGWNGADDVLTLSQHGAVVDTLQFSGSFTGDPFFLSQTAAGAMISLRP